MNQRLRLFTPHDSEKKPGMADASCADALILALDDTVAADRKDIVREQTLQHPAAEGFTGRIVIRPAQTCIINEAFAPSASAMEHTMRMAAVSGASGIGMEALDVVVVEVPDLKQARNVFEMHWACTTCSA
jgi:citrate lyase subunit beta/citryl-CoA lyase